MRFTRQNIHHSKLPAHVLEKWPHTLLSEGFVPFPKKLLRCLHEIFPDDDAVRRLAALLAIADYNRPNLSRQPSSQYLAFLAGLDEAEFETALKQMEKDDLIEVSGDSNELRVSMIGLEKKVQDCSDKDLPH